MRLGRRAATDAVPRSACPLHPPSPLPSRLLTDRLVRVAAVLQRIHHRWFELGNVPADFDDAFTMTEEEIESKRSSLQSQQLERFELSMDLPNVDKLRASSLRQESPGGMGAGEDDPTVPLMPRRAKTAPPRPKPLAPSRTKSKD